ncbi:hypothetical protein EHS25_010038 [Saitozyma podzolica]|uniref:THIF-type NAD/FAD binding fold domain-containing protein n=1 Tax=Saitozyma podzolica TaxID=1890683 RepID=A0A427YIF3_9TREE|nr:hypothetical protein EHS25_010038 [Saitozyma podzolica]
MRWGSSSVELALLGERTLLITAFASAIATTSLILSFQALRREHRTERLKRQVGEDVEEWERSRAGSGVASPEERAERWADGEKTPGGGRAVKEWEKGSLMRLTRNYNFLGEEAMAKVRDSYVVVVGCGGVGSWCALMLLRRSPRRALLDSYLYVLLQLNALLQLNSLFRFNSLLQRMRELESNQYQELSAGVGHLLLIDFDMTTLSSLNRHACATLEDVGSPKVIAMQKFLRKIAPWAQIDAHVGLWRKGDGEALLDGADWVVDAIDNIDTKVDLLTHCHKKGIKVFSSMGAGAKRDPTRVQIADISATYEDPLARSVRRRLRVNGITSGVPPRGGQAPALAEEEFQKGAVKELQAFDDFRVRILPVLGPLPAIFGLEIATFVILDVAGKPLTDYAEIKSRRKLYASLERSLSEREQRWLGLRDQARISVNQDDLALVFEDIYNGRSSLPPRTVLGRPVATRWDKRKELTEDNVVIMSVKDAEKHEAECLKGTRASRRSGGRGGRVRPQQVRRGEEGASVPKGMSWRLGIGMRMRTRTRREA